ncbi:hypothetical protein [Pseudonocardia kunmingensis]|uniref:ANTAR domain-containing protein n=1 Tax=Pseudonocardia kunmingensis TaxID=630975 RepID=A0A543DP86_9PSEU|nr:hypothetical protein [Pseudonocardia kunmingensis]TQM11154.1 hypothetical protein FB558_3706 [Pseudonocardia kunmingensis]
MCTPYYGDERRDAAALAAARALSETADVLRQVASHDMHVDVRRGDVSTSLAALVEAVGRGYRDVPHDVAACAMAVVGAVDRATGNRRFD